MNGNHIVIYVCHNSLPQGMTASILERQVRQLGAGHNVAVREVPCSGKTDVLYLLKTFEAGARGVAIVTCPLGECKLAEGNLRAQVRAGTICRLLNEIGLGGERMILLHGDARWQENDLLKSIEQAVAKLSALADNPMAGAKAPQLTGRGAERKQ